MRRRIFAIMKMVVMVHGKTFRRAFSHTARAPATLSLNNRVVICLAQFISRFDVPGVSHRRTSAFLDAPML